ncbi:MAG: TetR/AcrR family transcriptional regulator [Clostridiales bacterium]|nr:TetR/AcrR family transcriptional regulator [Clostridiales bacterium]
MTKAESKYFNTAKKMDEALLHLLEQKEFEFITVKEICEKAGVHRSTFYLHYETVGDLLSECVEGMNRQFNEYFQDSLSTFQQRIATSSLEQLFLVTPEYLLPYLTYISEHRTVFKVVLAQPEVIQTDKTYSTLFNAIFNPILERYGIPEGERDYVLTFYTQGMMGIVRRWLLLDCQTPVEDITRIIMNAVRR